MMMTPVVGGIGKTRTKMTEGRMAMAMVEIEGKAATTTEVVQP
jgi:hypothetical protein